MSKFILTLEYDEICECPSEWSEWDVFSFNKRHCNFKDPREFFSGVTSSYDPIPKTLGLRRKLEVGTAFTLSCYDHSLITWGLRGEVFQCRWDTAQLAGLLLWKSKPSLMPKGYKERAQMARDFLVDYNSWCNGECYSFILEDDQGNMIDSCGGFLGSDYFAEEIESLIKDKDVEVVGNAAHLSRCYHLSGA